MSVINFSLPASAETVAPLKRIDVFATAPQSLGADRDTYHQNVIDVARWSEEAGCTGILVYTDNGIVDPWLVSQVILAHTRNLCPLVAVQPVYMHPYTAAKMVTSMAYLYGRRVYLNMVAGGFANDLKSLNDTTAHDKRYTRLEEYTRIISGLLAGDTVTFRGEFYTVDRLALKPALPRELMPGILMSGSSPAGLATARAVGATAVRYPGPLSDYQLLAVDPSERQGIRVGIVAREEEDAAWAVAHRRFPPDRKGQMMHELAKKASDSSWHKQLSGLDAVNSRRECTYWLGPFQTSQTNCPYLVGTYSGVARELAGYLAAGFTTFILDIPADEDELWHVSTVFRSALEGQHTGAES